MKKKLGVLIILIVYGCVSKEQEILYYSDNSIKSKCTLIDGKRNGLLVEYYPDGTVSSRQQWSDGKLNGEVLRYYTNGQLGERSIYVNGIRSGCRLLYFETSELLEKQCYDGSGRLIDFTRYKKGGDVDYSVSAPIFYLKKDTISLSDTVFMYIRVANLDTSRIVKKRLFITSGFTNEGILIDTLFSAYMPSGDNFFEYSTVSKKIGLNQIFGRIECEMLTDSLNVTIKYSFNQPYFVLE